MAIVFKWSNEMTIPDGNNLPILSKQEIELKIDPSDDYDSNEDEVKPRIMNKYFTYY